MMLRFDKGVVVLGFKFLYYEQFTSSTQLMKSNFPNRRSLPRNRFVSSRNAPALPGKERCVMRQKRLRGRLQPEHSN